MTWPAVEQLDRVQQRSPWLAFPVAIAKKFGDDRAGSLAALIAYYGSSALFPLLLVLITASEIVLRDQAAQTFVAGAEINVVRHRRLWPRRLFPPPLGARDREAIADDVREQAPRPEVDVRVGFHDRSGGVDTGRGG